MDRGIWATWYDLADDSRSRFLDWLHTYYLPELQHRPGFAWSAHCPIANREFEVMVHYGKSNRRSENNKRISKLPSLTCQGLSV
jgi:hypothetical protein